VLRFFAFGVKDFLSAREGFPQRAIKFFAAGVKVFRSGREGFPQRA